MTGQVVYLDHCQGDLVGALKWLLEMAEKGELVSLIGVGAMEFPDDENVNIATIRAGAWAMNMFTTVGGLESMKVRLMVTVDESLQKELKDQCPAMP